MQPSSKSSLILSWSILPLNGLNLFTALVLAARRLVISQAAQRLFVIYIRDSIALRFEPFKRMYENGKLLLYRSFTTS